MKQKQLNDPIRFFTSQKTAQLKKNNVFEEDTDFLKRPTYRGNGLVSFDDLEGGLSPKREYAHYYSPIRFLLFNEDLEEVRTVQIREAIAFRLDMEQAGQEQVVYLHNISADTIRQPVPNDDSYRSMLGSSVEIPAGKILELSVTRYTPYYIIRGQVQP